jgi:hypothetical protein
VPSSIHSVIAGAGAPLDQDVRTSFERRFGTALSDVRIHDDPAAARSASDIGATAYTVGKDVVFADGAYRPDTAAGTRTLAHELTHVLQQRSLRPVAPAQLRISEPHEASEQAAEAVASGAMAGCRAAVEQADGPVVARAVDSDQQKAAAGDDGEVLDGDSPAGGPRFPIPPRPDQAAQGSSTSGQSAPEDDSGTQLVQRQGNQVHRPVPAEGRGRFINSIEIDLEDQNLVIHWSDRSPEEESQISSGRGRRGTAPRDPCATQTEVNCTPIGNYWPQFRGDEHYANGHGDHMSWYVDLGVHNAAGVDRGIGIHDSQAVTGAPASHGCVRVPPATARQINQNVAQDTMVHGPHPRQGAHAPVLSSRGVGPVRR